MTKRIKQHTFPASLTNFDKLPDSAHVRLPVVMGLYACSPATVWRGVKAGTIPKPRKIFSRTTIWLVRDLRQALAKYKEQEEEK